MGGIKPLHNVFRIDWVFRINETVQILLWVKKVLLELFCVLVNEKFSIVYFLYFAIPPTMLVCGSDWSHANSAIHVQMRLRRDETSPAPLRQAAGLDSDVCVNDKMLLSQSSSEQRHFLWCLKWNAAPWEPKNSNRAVFILCCVWDALHQFPYLLVNLSGAVAGLELLSDVVCD